MFSGIEDALGDLENGRPVIVLDSEDRENEGDLVIAAEHIDGEMVNFMISKCKGLVCVPMCKERLEKLNIGPMVISPDDQDQAAFTVSVDHREAGSGIGAENRAMTIRALASKESKAEDFIRPGHVFPLRANCEGIFQREGHTEASIELMKLANLNPIAVVCEILKEDGSPARRDDLFLFAKRYNLKLITIEALKDYIKEYSYERQALSF